MNLSKMKLAIAAALVTVSTGSAFAYPSHYHRTYVAPNGVYTSYPSYDRDYYRYNDYNVYKTNSSSYSRYPSSSYYNNGYYRNNGYYNTGPSIQVGPLRIDL